MSSESAISPDPWEDIRGWERLIGARLTHKASSLTLPAAGVFGVVPNANRIGIMLASSNVTPPPSFAISTHTSTAFVGIIPVSGVVEFLWQKHGPLVQGSITVTSNFTTTTISIWELIQV